MLASSGTGLLNDRWRELVDMRYMAALGLILTLKVLLTWRYFAGLVHADDFSYGVYAYSLFRIPLTWDAAMDFRVLRFILLWPTALVFTVFTPTVLTAVLYPMALSFGTVVLVYGAGALLYGTTAGLLGAFMLAVFPADVLYGSMLLPDSVTPFFVAAVVVALIAAEFSEGRLAKVLYAIAGFALFAAMNARENSYLFAVFFLPFALSGERWRKGLYLAAAFFVVPEVLVGIVFYAKSGDFLYNLHLAGAHRDAMIASGAIPPNSVNWNRMFYYLFPGLFGRAWKSALFGWTFYLAVPCLLYTAVRAALRRRLVECAPLWWFVVVYALLEFGSVSFDRYQMMQKLPRFLLTLTPAAALACGAVLADSLGAVRAAKIHQSIRWATAIPAIAVTAFFAADSMGVMQSQQAAMHANISIFKWAHHEVFAGRENRPVYGTGGWWENKLSFYFLPDLRYADMPWRRSDMLRDLGEVTDSAELGGSYVVIDRNNFSGNNDLRIRHAYSAFPGYVKAPPEEWTLLGSRALVEIYEVPEGWTYAVPDARTLVHAALMHGIEVGDAMLMIDCLHPDFINEMGRDNLITLLRVLTNPNEPLRGEFLEHRLEYRDFNGTEKIVFTRM